MIELNTVYNEPCLDTIKRFEDNSIDCVITSPPYWQLRDYGYPEQWGLEPTFNEYLDHLWEMMDGIYKALKPSGTVWINLGDTYGTKSGNFSNGNSLPSKLSYIGAIDNYTKPLGMDKCLLLLPHRFAIGCMERGWIVRNDIIWAKRNAMPEPCTDRFSKKHEYFFLLVKSKDYFFDMNAIRDKVAPLNRWGGNKLKANGISKWDLGTGSNTYRDRDMQPNGGMKNPGDVSDFWNIPTKPSASAHYAQYSGQLISKPILAGCPKGGLIYDPFMGIGTTALAAIKYQRNFIGSEMSEEYLKIANQYILPALKQTHLF